jgi:hypothetical protein
MDSGLLHAGENEINFILSNRTSGIINQRPLSTNWSRGNLLAAISIGDPFPR